MAYKITHADSELFAIVADWARAAGWKVASEANGKTVEPRAEQSSAALVIETPTGERIQLEPAGVRKDGTDIVDVLAWPTLTRIRLLNAPGNKDWVMVTDEGIPFGYRWTRDDFIKLAGYMVAA